MTRTRFFDVAGLATLLALGCTGSAGEEGAEGTPGAGCTITSNDDGTATINCGGQEYVVENGENGEDGEDGEDGVGSPGSPGAPCTMAADTPEVGQATITCGDDEFVVATGAPGDPGASCTAAEDLPDNPGTWTVTCGDTDFTIANGIAGIDGDDCTAVEVAGGIEVTCGGDTVTISDGAAGSAGDDCAAVDNGDGSYTITCGTSTVTLSDGENAMDVDLLNFHGTDFLLTEGEFALEENPKFFVDVEITGASVADGITTVEFTVEADGEPYAGVTSISADIVKLAPAADDEAWNKWVPYIYRKQTVSVSERTDDLDDWPAANEGNSAWQPTTESNTGTAANKGALTDNLDGSYTYAFGNDLDTTPGTAGYPTRVYDATATHRISIMMGGHSGPTGDANFDFRPDGNAITETRNIVQTATCQQCHGWEFHGHGGNRLSVEGCVTCHNPSNTDPHSGNLLDGKVMFHKIHAGGELASIPGADGKVWDDPATAGDESADNGEYAIWGNRNTRHDWWKVGFPAVIENCTKCHQGSGEDVDNWKTKPSRVACGSCHDDVDFASGTNHPGGDQDTDDGCTFCHPDSGAIDDDANIFPIPAVHDWAAHDPRKQPEFAVELTVSEPPNGEYFDVGEAPVVTVKLTDVTTDTLINHTLMTEAASAQGCVPDSTDPSVCNTTRDNAFSTSAFFVHGPRARRVPALTTASALPKVTGSGAGPFDISASGAKFEFNVDGGLQIVDGPDTTSPGMFRPGFISISVPSAGSFASKAAATVDELVAWLNANAGFAARATASKDASGKLVVQTRGLGTVPAMQVVTTAGATGAQVFTDLATKVISGSTISNKLTSTTDTKVVRTAGEITYTLDAITVDTRPGTYTAFVEITDRGNKSDTDYQTPSVARVNFQVRQAEEEPFVARNCSTCHMGPDGKGFVLDWRRHNKLFNDTALDQCGNCHDYLSGAATGDWNGARPISKRVHAVHFGSSLNYPLATVWYSNGDPVKGRNWEITLPQDVRNCEVCHTEETSGTWATKPARIPCWGCHDSDEAQGHFKAMTYDPTPANPYSGDEEESCALCH